MTQDLTIFIGSADDAENESNTIYDLQQRIDSYLQQLNKMNDEVNIYHRVKMFYYRFNSDPLVGGQEAVITPHIKNASIAIFIFKHKVGKVTLKELDYFRQRPTEKRIHTLALFPEKSPDPIAMNELKTIKNWTAVVRLKEELIEKWDEGINSDSVTPSEPYKDLDHLSDIVYSHIYNILPDIAKSKNLNNPLNKMLEITNIQKEISFFDKTTPVTEFDEKAISYYRENLRQEHRPFLPTKLTTVEFLQQMALIHDNGHLTNCGALLFSQNPTSVIPSAIIRTTIYEGIDKSSARNRKNHTGPLLSQIIASRQFITDSIEHREKSSTDSMMTRKIYKYPMICIREMLANAICHREYDNDERIIYVHIFTDRIEISSPGSWMGRTLEEDKIIPLSNLEGRSVQRNIRLAQIISYIDIVEMEGSGILTSIVECSKISAPEPTVIYSDGFVTLTIYPRTNWDDVTDNSNHKTERKRKKYPKFAKTSLKEYYVHYGIAQELISDFQYQDSKKYKYRNVMQSSEYKKRMRKKTDLLLENPKKLIHHGKSLFERVIDDNLETENDPKTTQRYALRAVKCFKKAIVQVLLLDLVTTTHLLEDIRMKSNSNKILKEIFTSYEENDLLLAKQMMTKLDSAHEYTTLDLEDIIKYCNVLRNLKNIDQLISDTQWAYNKVFFSTRHTPLRSRIFCILIIMILIIGIVVTLIKLT